MWFITGLVLVYHPYPAVNQEKNNEVKEPLPGHLSCVPDYIPRGVSGLKSVKLRQFLGQTLVDISAKDTSFTILADSGEKPDSLSFGDITCVAKTWSDGEIVSVDTLNEREQWVLYERYNKVLPIYKYRFNDVEQTEVFISSRTGEVQQHTTKSQRLWAWLGAIPHKLYFETIRKDVDVWKLCLTIGGIMCFVAALSGTYVGVLMLRARWMRTRRFETPYKKGIYRLHHVIGVVVCVSLIGWGISGFMSMQKVPQWIVPVKGKDTMKGPDFWKGDTLSLADIDVSVNEISSQCSDLKELTLRKLGNKTVCVAIDGSKELFLNADGSKMEHTEADLRCQLVNLYGEDVKADVSLLTEYDEYYLAYDESLPLPVYKVVVDDENGTRFYVHPYSDKVKYQNKNRMVRKWLFSALHYLNFSWLVQHKALWTVLLWFLALSGAVVSLTGFIISVIRIFFRKRR
jgi:hypothetical protein